MKDLADLIIEMGKQLDGERNVAYDLWSWLPSRAATEKHHGQYADNFTPSVKDIMIEASAYIAHLKVPERKLTTEDQETFVRCACGEDHVGE